MAILLIISTGGLTYLNEMGSIIPQVEALVAVEAPEPPDLSNLLWSKTYGGTDRDEGYSVQVTSDGGYIIAGYTVTRFFDNRYGNLIDELDVYLVKTDSDGNMLWNQTYGGTGDYMGYSVQVTSDGGYIIAGYIESFGTDEVDVYLVKTNSDGNLLWSQTYGDTGSGYAHDDYGWSVLVASDGGYIIVGHTWSFGAGGTDVYLVKIGPKVTTTTTTSTTMLTTTATLPRITTTVTTTLPRITLTTTLAETTHTITSTLAEVTNTVVSTKYGATLSKTITEVTSVVINEGQGENALVSNSPIGIGIVMAGLLIAVAIYMHKSS